MMATIEDVLDRLKVLEDEVASYKMKIVRLERKLQESQGRIQDLEMKGEVKAATTTTTTKMCADSCKSCKKVISNLTREVEVLKQEQLETTESREKVKKLQTVLNTFILNRLKNPQVQEQEQSTKKNEQTDGKGQPSSISTTQGVSTIVPPAPRFASTFFASFRCSGVQIDYSSGIISRTPSASFSRFISARPLNSQLRFFSLEIIKPGWANEIGIGVCPTSYPNDNMPGWAPGSIGYHSDNGGIYIEGGYAKVKVATCKVGDVMGCQIDESRNTVTFFRNHEKVTKQKVPFPVFKLHAMVGMQKGDVAVKLLEREVLLS